MFIPALLLAGFEIDVFNGYFIFNLKLAFSKETVVTVFMTYELLLSIVAAISVTYLIAILVNLFKEVYFWRRSARHRRRLPD
jgi:hypothetical protein